MSAEFDQGSESQVALEKQDEEWFEDFPTLLTAIRGRASQSGFAALAGFDPSYINRLEKGTRTPTYEAVERIAEVRDLDDVQTDRLLASARFRGRGNTIPYNETAMLTLVAALMSREVAEDIKEKVRSDIGKIALKYGFLFEEDEE